MSKVKNISGFPEWLPEEKLLEDEVVTRIRRVFQSFGFTPIETPAVELISTLSSKGVIDKEIYALRRALQSPGEGDDEELGLHFDLTVPFARYVGVHYNELQFPFKRYQLQKVWRGDRPQKGRFREFYQFDVDTIARETLPVTCDSEIITVLDRAFSVIGVGTHLVRVNNRKILLGIYESLGLSANVRSEAIRVVDKLDKIGKDGVRDELTKTLKLDSKIAGEICALTEVRGPLASLEEKLSGLAFKNELFLEGCGDLRKLAESMPEETQKRVQLDLSLARGLDYYTGAIFEISLPEHPEFGTVASGGRYDDLASQFINKKLPGVGGSIGLTRLMDLILRKKLLTADKKVPTKVLVTVYSEEQRTQCVNVSEELRACGISTETFFTSPKLGKQIEYADSKKIPYVLFINSENGSIEIKNLQTKEQIAVPDLKAWCRTVQLKA